MTFSPGIAASCFELLSIVKRHSTVPAAILSIRQIGVVETSVALDRSQRLGWIQINEEGLLEVTAQGERLLAEGPISSRLRIAISDFLDVTRPPWLQNAAFGRRKLLSFADRDIGQLFAEAGLVHSEDADVIAFWDGLASRARGLRDDRLSAIGRRGEEKSREFETARTGQRPKWIALESAEDGYDLLSIVARDDAQKLLIEVKASSIGVAGLFHLTRNEWELAESAARHVFHLWAFTPNATLLAVLPPQEVRDHVPVDAASGRWEGVQIPFSIFKDKFRAV